MRKIHLLTVLLSISVLFGCPKKPTDDADAAAEAGTAEAPIDAAAAPVIAAKNSADVARFAGETAVSETAKTLQQAFIRTSPKGGNIVATLPANTNVTKVAEFQGSFLVTFADPKDANTTLMGWVDKTGFTPFIAKPKDAGVVDAVAVVDAGVAPQAKLTCPNGFGAVIITPPNAVCKKKCQTDKDCRTVVAGNCQNANGQFGGVIRACVND